MDRSNFAVGDVLEIAAIICAGAFVFIYFAPVWTLLVAAAGLFYVAQDWSSVQLPRPKLPRLKLPRPKLRKGDT